MSKSVPWLNEGIKLFLKPLKKKQNQFIFLIFCNPTNQSNGKLGDFFFVYRFPTRTKKALMMFNYINNKRQSIPCFQDTVFY